LLLLWVHEVGGNAGSRNWWVQEFRGEVTMAAASSMRAVVIVVVAGGNRSRKVASVASTSVVM